MTREEFYKRLSELDSKLSSGNISRSDYDIGIQKLIDGLITTASNKKSWVTDEMSQLMQRSAGAVDYLNQQRDLARQGKLSAGLVAGVNLLTSGLMLGAAGKQIATAKRAARQLIPPALPSVPGRDPRLEQALSQAALGTIDVSQILGPARSGIQDAYFSALEQAKVATGGQAGAYQAMTNLANLQRMRANAGLAPITQEAKLQNQQIYNQLLGQRLGETQNIFENQAIVNQLGQQQYNMDAAAIGALGQAGGGNLWNAALRGSYGLQQSMPYLVSNLSKVFKNLPSDYQKQATQEAVELSTRRAPYENPYLRSTDPRLIYKDPNYPY